MLRTSFYFLRQIWKVKQSLTANVLATLVHALILGRVDYCNTLYVGLPDCSIYRLQTVLNASARLISGTARWEHISSFIRNQLHWLPVALRVQFKLLSMVCNCLNDTAPAYLRELWNQALIIPGRSALRYSSHGDLIILRFIRLASYQRRSFAISAPSLWNCLPPAFRHEILSLGPATFRQKLKTFLFDRERLWGAILPDWGAIQIQLLHYITLHNLRHTQVHLPEQWFQNF